MGKRLKLLQDFYHRIEGCVNDIKVEKTKQRWISRC